MNEVEEIETENEMPSVTSQVAGAVVGVAVVAISLRVILEVQRRREAKKHPVYKITDM
jgi:hypothetical protein